MLVKWTLEVLIRRELVWVSSEGEVQLYQWIAARSSSYFIIADINAVYGWIPDVYTGLGLAVGHKITGVLYMCSIRGGKALFCFRAQVYRGVVHGLDRGGEALIQRFGLDFPGVVIKELDHRYYGLNSCLTRVSVWTWALAQVFILHSCKSRHLASSPALVFLHQSF